MLAGRVEINIIIARIAAAIEIRIGIRGEFVATRERRRVSTVRRTGSPSIGLPANRRSPSGEEADRS